MNSVRRFFFILCLLAAPGIVSATTEYLGTVNASQVATGLGFNLTTSNDWEWAAAKAAGATYGRIQCSWVSTEGQAAPPADTSTGYSLQSDCVTALNSASAHGIKPTIVAAYGAPYHTILTVTVPAGAAQGATTLSITVSSGVGGSTVSSMRAVWNTILPGVGFGSLTPQHDYAGSIITGVTVTGGTTATITLASGLTNALPANGTTYQINEYLYQSPSTASYTATNNVNYANYAQYLAQQIAAKGLGGNVELWNEPPWPDSCWDNYGDCFDPPYSGSGATIGVGVANQGFAGAVQNATVPANVSYIWAGTNKSGDNTLLNGNMLSRSGLALAQPTSKISSESLHPYGNNPEDEMWSQPCLVAQGSGAGTSPYPYVCNLFGVGSNVSESAGYDVVAKVSNPTFGLGRSITETGVQQSIGTQIQTARFIMRQFFGYQAAGVTPIEFYRLYDNSGQGFGFGTFSSTFAPYQQYRSLQALMADVSAIKSAPVATVSTTSLIASSSGLTWPLDSMQIVGSRRSSDAVNSVLVAAWQRTYNNSGTWASIASPSPGSMTVNVPSGTAVFKVIDTVTQVPVTYTVSGSQIIVPVADDPVEMMFTTAANQSHNLGAFNGVFN